MEFPVHIMLHLVSEPMSCIHRKHYPIKTRVFYFSSWVLLFSQWHAFIHILCLFKNVVPQPSQWRSEPDSCRWKYIPTGLQPPMTLRQTSRPNGRWVFVFAAHLFLLDFINNVFVIYSSLLHFTSIFRCMQNRGAAATTCRPDLQTAIWATCRRSPVPAVPPASVAPATCLSNQNGPGDDSGQLWL